MRAALLQRFNALDSIKLTLDAPVPVCKPNEVRKRAECCLFSLRLFGTAA